MKKKKPTPNSEWSLIVWLKSFMPMIELINCVGHNKLENF